ncbi:hypothetical protein HDU96_007787 [Phlyctochytrium bullatum]|nr:hypothetical protein HDU96_007787 [Phlyctochytrium bullatum]
MDAGNPVERNASLPRRDRGKEKAIPAVIVSRPTMYVKPLSGGDDEDERPPSRDDSRKGRHSRSFHHLRMSKDELRGMVRVGSRKLHNAASWSWLAPFQKKVNPQGAKDSTNDIEHGGDPGLEEGSNIVVYDEEGRMMPKHNPAAMSHMSMDWRGANPLFRSPSQNTAWLSMTKPATTFPGWFGLSCSLPWFLRAETLRPLLHTMFSDAIRAKSLFYRTWKRIIFMLYLAQIVVIPLQIAWTETFVSSTPVTYVPLSSNSTTAAKEAPKDKYSYVRTVSVPSIIDPTMPRHPRVFTPALGLMLLWNVIMIVDGFVQSRLTKENDLGTICDDPAALMRSYYYGGSPFPETWESNPSATTYSKALPIGQGIFRLVMLMPWEMFALAYSPVEDKYGSYWCSKSIVTDSFEVDHSTVCKHKVWAIMIFLKLLILFPYMDFYLWKFPRIPMPASRLLKTLLLLILMAHIDACLFWFTEMTLVERPRWVDTMSLVPVLETAQSSKFVANFPVNSDVFARSSSRLSREQRRRKAIQQMVPNLEDVLENWTTLGIWEGNRTGRIAVGRSLIGNNEENTLWETTEARDGQSTPPLLTVHQLGVRGETPRKKSKPMNETLTVRTQFLISYLAAVRCLQLKPRYVYLNWERSFVIFESIIGVLVYGFIAGNVHGIVEMLDRSATENEAVELHKLEITYLRNALIREGVPVEIQKKAIAFKEVEWQKNKGFDEDFFFADLPGHLLQTIKNHLYLDLVKKLPMFAEADDAFLSNVTLRMKSIVITNSVYIFRKDEEGKEMYFVLSGAVEIEIDAGGVPKVIATLGPGAFFGEIALFESCRRTASARAKGNVELCVIEKDDFDEILNARPGMREYFAEVIRRKRENDAKRNANGGEQKPPEKSRSLKKKSTLRLDRKWSREKTQGVPASPGAPAPPTPPTPPPPPPIATSIIASLPPPSLQPASTPFPASMPQTLIRDQRRHSGHSISSEGSSRSGDRRSSDPGRMPRSRKSSSSRRGSVSGGPIEDIMEDVAEERLRLFKASPR